ncbi:MAG: GIY-YIG nuclease family protein [Alphaproteobacteria bacterium]|nr:MAG: GIY-YIG nuclease family protein [Alphaproteobacteria bacterium]
MERDPCVYILASRRNGTLYTGVTSNLFQRLYQHRERLKKGFTDRYAICRLVWFEQHGEMETAIRREKQLKNWHRDWKVQLIEGANPDWHDLAIGFGFDPLPEPKK